ncbi:MAG TPA: hypothetical protein PLO55_13310, partial [Thermotogota bacterium]|nr:hypothetical protein [Thermotogota bacterium]
MRTMKNSVVMIIGLLFLSLNLFAGVSDAQSHVVSVNKAIDTMGLSWKAGFTDNFLKIYGAGVETVGEMDALLNQYIFIDLEDKLTNDSGARLTTTDDLIWSSYRIVNPLETITVPTFYRLEPIR